MPQIKALTLINYKSLRNVEIELSPLNILIGKNGAGKSNLISFFRLLCEAANEHLADSLRGMGGFNEIRWRRSNERDSVEWELALKNLKQVDHPIYYSGQLTGRGTSFSVGLEEVSRDPYPGYQDRYRFLSVSDGRIRFLAAKTGDIENEMESETDYKEYNYKDQELVVAQVRDPVRYPLLDEIRHSLSDWMVFRGFGENALQNIYKSQALEASDPLRLDPQGLNLVSVLHSLANEAQYSSAYAALIDILEEAFPDFQKLDLKIVATGMVELHWRSRDFPNKPAFPARSVSDGMLRFIGLATLLLLPDPPPLVVIDEPEIGLHPELIPLLAGLLKQASERTQIIVTTHSPALLSSEDIELSDIVLVERKNGETIMERADSRANLDRWLERYTLGQLWTMGKLEG